MYVAGINFKINAVYALSVHVATDENDCIGSNFGKLLEKMVADVYFSVTQQFRITSLPFHTILIGQHIGKVT